MPYIKVDTDKIKGYRNDIDGIKGRMEEISRTYASTFWAIDSGAYSKDPGIRTVGNRIYDEISSETMVLARMKTFLAKALSEYDCTLETYKKTTKKLGGGGSFSGTEDKINDYFEKKDLRAEKDKEKYYKNGKEISKDDAPTFYDLNNRTAILEGTIGGELLYGNLFQIGSREDEDGDGTYGYVAIGEGEVHASLSAGLYVLDGDGNKIFSPGVKAEIGGSVSILHAEGEVQLLGDDNFGLDLTGEAKIGSVGAEASAVAQIYDENGKLNVQAQIGAKAEAIAAEVQGSIGLDVLGGGVAVTGGVNFGIGAHAEVGIKDGVIKCDVGVSIGLGVSLSFEVDVAGMVNTVCEKAQTAVKAVANVAKKIFKGW